MPIRSNRCLAAQEAGADRVELCAAMYDGGTTPSPGTIRLARELLNIELYVMIRPRGGDFLYTELEYRQMKADLLFAKSCGADGVVIGLLDENGRVDVARTRELVELAAPMKVTFHRAFDMTVDYHPGFGGCNPGGLLPDTDFRTEKYGCRRNGGIAGISTGKCRAYPDYGRKRCRER